MKNSMWWSSVGLAFVLILIVSVALVLMPLGNARADAPPGPIVVTPADMKGWAFVDDNGHGGTGQMVSGPAIPPVGTGSARLAVSDTSQGYILTAPLYQGTRLADITSLQYSTYRTSGGAALAVSLQFNIDDNLNDTDTSWKGRLVFEPYNSRTVSTGVWQTWDPRAGKWWATKAPLNSFAPQSSPKTWDQILAQFPNIGIHPTLGAVVFKAGSGWTSFDGNVDFFQIGVSGAITGYNFDPAPPAATITDVSPPSPCAVPLAGQPLLVYVHTRVTADGYMPPVNAQLTVSSGTTIVFQGTATMVAPTGAAFDISTLGPGGYSLAASFFGTDSYAPSSASGTMFLGPCPTATDIGLSPGPYQPNQTITASVHTADSVFGAGLSGPQTLTIVGPSTNFSLSGTSNNLGLITFNFTVPSAGTYTVTDVFGGTVVHNDKGDNSQYLPSQASTSFSITPPAPPKFSFVPGFPTDCICTPLVMNTNVTGSENWFVKARGTNLKITLTAHSVNNADPETVEARVFDTSPGGGQVDGVLSASYPAGTPAGSEVSSTQSYPTADGRVYRIQITTPPPTTARQPHYRLRFVGAAEAAIKSPTFASLEHVPDSRRESVMWFFNVAHGETPQVQVFWDGTPGSGNPGFAPSITVQWIDQGNVVGGPWTLIGPTPQTVPWPSNLQTGRAWPLKVQPADDHYRLKRIDAATDPDIYLTAVTYGQGTISGTVVTGSGAPFITTPDAPVTIRLRSPSGGSGPGPSVTTTDGTYSFNARVGPTRVEVVPPPGATVLGSSFFDVFVACGQTVTVPPFKLNRVPGAANDSASAPVFASTSIDVLANDTDPDGDALTVTSVTQTSNGGVVAIAADGKSVIYTPGPGTYPTDSFSYTVKDSYGATATATVTVKIEVPNLANGKITGGVLRFGNNGRGGFNVQSDATGAVKGELEYQNGSVNLHAKTMTAIAISADRTKGWFAGILDDGRQFVAYVEDNGEPGTNDVFKLWVDGALQNGDGKLTGGNVQIHKP